MTRALLNIVIASALFIALLVGYVFWYAAVRDMSAQAASLSDQIDARQQDSQRAASARRALDSMTTDEAALSSHFVSAGSVVPYLEGIENTGTSLGTTITVGSVSQEDTPRSHLALSLSVKGSFTAVMRMLGTIEYGPIDAEISNVTLDTVPSTASSSTQWTAAVTMSVGMESGGAAPAAPAASPADDSTL